MFLNMVDGLYKKEVLYLQYFYYIFTTNHRWLVVIDSNLNLPLRLLFFPNNNNLPPMIYCENVVNIAFFFFFLVEEKWGPLWLYFTLG